MEPEHAHLNAHPSIAPEHKVFSKEHVEAVARAALKHIPGSKPLLDKTFSKRMLPEYFAPKKIYNQPMYMPW
jgi:hypothetical protein